MKAFPIITTVISDIWLNLAFFTRLRVPAELNTTHQISQASYLFPAIGLIIASLLILPIYFLNAIGIPPMATATIVFASMALVTGALHEDGLADCADGFGGGQDKFKKLLIMKDSSIGTFGLLALVFTLLCKIALFAYLLEVDLGKAIAVLIFGATISRLCALIHWYVLPPARESGTSASAGQPTLTNVLSAASYTIAASLILSIGMSLTISFLTAVLVCGLFLALFTLLCARQISGQTGDTIGATQQLCELSFYFAITAFIVA